MKTVLTCARLSSSRANQLRDRVDTSRKLRTRAAGSSSARWIDRRRLANVGGRGPVKTVLICARLSSSRANQLRDRVDRRLKLMNTGNEIHRSR